MKNFKIGFLAIVALFAMSFTIASKTGLLSEKANKLSITPGCYTQGVLNDATTLSGSMAQFSGVSSQCESANSIVKIRKSLTDYNIDGTSPDFNNSFFVTSVSANDLVDKDGGECPDPYEIFCCYDLDSDGKVLAICFKDDSAN